MTLNARHVSPSVWWASRRLQYNIALASAGAVAFVLYAVLVWSFQDKLPDAEITLFTIAFQALGFLLVMAAANILYFLGPLSERVLRPRNAMNYRETTYALGFWFSVALPFVVPAVVLVAVVRRT